MDQDRDDIGSVLEVLCIWELTKWQRRHFKLVEKIRNYYRLY